MDVVSAGTFAFLGMGPTRETLKLIQEIGLDASVHRAQRLIADTTKSADLIIAMENRHKEEIVRHWPEAAKRTRLLGELAKLDPFEQEVPDPIGKSEDFYKMSFQKIKDAIDKLDI